MEGQHGVVVHVTTGEVRDWQRALRNLRNLVADESVPTPARRMTVVVNGPAARFLLASSPESSKLRRIVEAGVAVRACSTSLDRLGHDRDEVVEGAELVDSGVAEVVRAQNHGNSYLKLP